MNKRSTATTSQGERRFHPGASQQSPSHLRNRDEELVALGWKKGAARWLALVAFHSGLFLRSQYAAFHGCSEATARRFVARLIAGNWAREFPIALERGGRSPLVCHLTARSVYRELGIEHTRYRRRASERMRWRRLLCLDYVIDHPHLPWLPTDQDRVAYFRDQLGISLNAVPRRNFTDRAGQPAARYFPTKLPIAAAKHLVTFVYPVAGFHDVSRWPRWIALLDPLCQRVRAKGRAVRVLVLTRTTSQAWHFERELSALRPPLTAATTDHDRRQLATLAAIKSPEHWHSFGEAGRLAPALEVVTGIRRALVALDGRASPVIECGATHHAKRLEPEDLIV